MFNKNVVAACSIFSAYFFVVFSEIQSIYMHPIELVSVGDSMCVPW